MKKLIFLSIGLFWGINTLGHQIDNVAYPMSTYVPVSYGVNADTDGKIRPFSCRVIPDDESSDLKVDLATYAFQPSAKSDRAGSKQITSKELDYSFSGKSDDPYFGSTFNFTLSGYGGAMIQCNYN